MKRECNKIQIHNTCKTCKTFKLLTAAFLLVCHFCVFAVEITPHDKRSKTVIAGMISGFLSYTKWPQADPAVPFKVAVLGEDTTFFTALERYLAQKSEKARTEQKAQYQFLAVQITVEQLTCCQVLVVLGDSNEFSEEIIAKLANLPILTISDQRHFAAAGGHVNFYYQQSKLRFKVNWQATVNSKLKMSSRLLSLAKVINK